MTTKTRWDLVLAQMAHDSANMQAQAASIALDAEARLTFLAEALALVRNDRAFDKLTSPVRVTVEEALKVGHYGVRTEPVTCKVCHSILERGRSTCYFCGASIPPG